MTVEGQSLEALGLGFHRGPIVAWLVCANLAVLVAALRWWKYSFYIHVFFACIVIFISLMVTIPIFKVWIPSIPYYIQNYHSLTSHDKIQFIHDFIGFIAILLVSIQIITGTASRYIKRSPTVNPKIVILIRKSHIICSFFIMILAKFNYLEIIYRELPVKIEFICLLIADVISLGLYFVIKYRYHSFQKIITNLGNIIRLNKAQNAGYMFLVKLKEIITPPKPFILTQEKMSTLTNIPKYCSSEQIKLPNYILFNDYVYDTTNLLHIHPGGQFIIQKTNHRQIDRFIYGSSPLQLLPQMIIKKHSKDSLQICGCPIAKMQRISPMEGFLQLNMVKSYRVKKINNKSQVYKVELKVDGGYGVDNEDGKGVGTERQIREKKDGLKFNGFTHASQFAQYFTLSATKDSDNSNVQLTRLYTTIWSMRPKNVEFMQKYFLNCLSDNNKINNPSLQQIIVSSQLQKQKQRNFSEVIPLVMKKYQSGQFTSKVLSNEFMGRLIISSPMGGGMEYEKILKCQGKVILISGGTGLLPFGDFIDIMFKHVKYLEQTNLSVLLAENDPLVKEDLIGKREFYLYHACEYMEDIPEIYLYQLNELSKSSRINFKITFRVSKDADKLKQIYKNSPITLTKDYFNILIKKVHLINDEQKNKISKVYVWISIVEFSGGKIDGR